MDPMHALPPVSSVPLHDGLVDLVTGRIRREGHTDEQLSDIERRLLARLVDADGAVSREQLLEDVWELDPRLLTRAVDTAVRRLRKKLEPDPSTPVYVLTEHGRGYRFQGLNAGASGREDWITRLRHGTARLISLIGPSGQGKSWVAERACPRSVFVCLEGCASAEQMFARLADACGRPVRSHDPVGVAQALRERPTLILDATEALFEPCRSLVEGLLEVAPDLQLRTTGHRPLDLPGEEVLLLPPLPTAPARRLFCSVAGCPDGDRVEDVVERLGGHPLALRIVAGWWPSVGWEGLDTLLDAHLPTLPRREEGPDHQRTLESSVRQTLDRLPAPTVDLLRRLGTVRGSFDLSDVLALGPDDALARIDALDRGGLLRPAQPGWSCYAVVRACLPPSEADRAAHARWVLDTVPPPEEAVDRDPDAIRQVVRRLPDALEALPLLGASDPVGAARLLGALHPVLLRRHPNQAHLALLRAPWTESLTGEARRDLLGWQAEVLRVQGRLDEAREVVAEARQAGDSVHLRFTEALLAHLGGDPAAGRLYAELDRPDSPPRIQAFCRLWRGIEHGGSMDGVGRSLRQSQEAAEIARRADLPLLEAACLQRSALLLYARGRMVEALQDLERADRTFARFGDERYLAQNGWTAAQIELRLGRVDRAREHAERALELCEALGLAGLEVTVLTMLALADLYEGDRDSGAARLEEAVLRARRTSTETYARLALCCLAVLAADAGDRGLAEARIARATELWPDPAQDVASAHLSGAPLPDSDDPDALLLLTWLRGRG